MYILQDQSESTVSYAVQLLSLSFVIVVLAFIFGTILYMYMIKQLKILHARPWLSTGMSCSTIYIYYCFLHLDIKFSGSGHSVEKK